MKRLLSATLLPLPLTLAACIDRAVTKVEPDTNTTENLEFNVELNPKLDILFVVDNSGSMRREQAELLANFPAMIDVLETLPTGRPDLHVGVITTDAGGCTSVEPGLLVDEGDGCDPLSGAAERFLIDEDDGSGTGTRRVNYTGGDLGAAFSCLADRGTQGCGFEQPLESIEAAVTRAENQGFFRADALLAVVLLSDEDDCSAHDDGLFSADPDDEEALGPRTSLRCFAHGLECNPDLPALQLGVRNDCQIREDDEFMTPVDQTIAALRELKPLASRLIVAGIVGDLPTATDPLEIGIIQTRNGDEVAVLPQCDLPGSCGDGNCNVGESEATCPADCTGTVPSEGAAPPVRTAAFLSQFENHIQERICQADLSPAIEKIGEEIVKQVYGACIEGTLADANPELDGLQPDCSVTEVQAPLTDDEVRTILPQCTGGDPENAPNQPCWTVEVDDRCEIASDHMLRIKLHYPDGVDRDSDTIVQAQCVTE